MRLKYFIVSPKGELLRASRRDFENYGRTHSRGQFFLWVKFGALVFLKPKRSLLN